MPTRKQLEAVARAYEAMPSGRTGDRDAEWSYEAFRVELIAQHRAIPITVEPWPHEGQPYADSAGMFADAERGHLSVYTGGDEHPYLTRGENVMFRAVHDYYGHFLGRNPFGPLGEFRAWQAHCKMFSGGAIPALTAELLGQNCWVNYGPFSHLPPAARPYAEQKAGLLPEELWLPLLTGGGDVYVSRFGMPMRFPGF